MGKKEKFTMHATFCLTRHPMAGVEHLKKAAEPSEPTIAAASSWLEQAEKELQDPALGSRAMNASWPDFGDMAARGKKIEDDAKKGKKKKGKKGQAKAKEEAPQGFDGNWSD